MNKRMMPDAKFYIGRRDTRWDVYPQREPSEAVGHDYWGFWTIGKSGEWFLTPTSYVFEREVTKAEAEAFHAKR